MATEYGFVYILSNQCMPGVYKIGFTLYHPNTRMDQLSAATACPTPFELTACFGCEDPRQVEKYFHNCLRKYRINQSREFFKVSHQVLLDLVHAYASSEKDMVNTRGLDILEWEYQLDANERDRKEKIAYFLSQNADASEMEFKKIGFQ